MSRRYLIIVSVAAHAALGVGIFVSGIWKIERLDYQHRASLTLGALMPPGEAGGGEGEKQEAKQEKKKDQKKTKTKVKEPRQVEKLQRDEADDVALETTGGGGGEGEGEGPGVGPATGGGGGGTCDPLVDPDQCQGPPAAPQAACGNRVLEAKEECDDGNLLDGDKCSATCTIEQLNVPPQILTGLRTSGETQIVPPDPVKTEMLRGGKDRTVGSFKLCIDRAGTISAIAPIGGGTKYPAYDSKIVSTMRAWRYDAYRVNGRPVPVCSVVTFVYTIK